MKKLSKFALGIALFLVLSGGLMAISGRVMGGSSSIELSRYGRTMTVTPFGIRGFYTLRSGAYATESVALPGATSYSQRDLATLTALDINVDMADVIFKEGDDFGADLSWHDDRTRLYSEINDGILSVWEEDHISFGPGPDVQGGTVTITYPAGTRFDDVHASTAMGSITLSRFGAGSLTVEANMGSLSISNVTAEYADLNLDMGDVTSKNFTVSGLVTAHSSMGDIELAGTFHKMDLSANMGSIEVDTALPKSEYNWDLSADMGDLSVDGTSESDWDHSYIGGDGDNEIIARCSFGDVTLRFS